MQAHTSTEIAQAMVDRAFASVRRYPQPVELPSEECTECGGEGCLDHSRVPYLEELRPCRACHGSGSVVPGCILCRDDATTVIFDGSPSPVLLCEDHALDTRHLDGEDLAVAFALRTLP